MHKRTDIHTFILIRQTYILIIIVSGSIAFIMPIIVLLFVHGRYIIYYLQTAIRFVIVNDYDGSCKSKCSLVTSLSQ